MSINRSLHRIAQEGVIQTLEEKDKEIERLKNGCKELEQQIDDLYKLETTLTNENERLNNIIGEAIEYIKNHREAVDERAGHIIYILKDDFDEEDILKILDK